MITFYRCLLCTTVVSKWDVQSGDGCPKCGGRKMSPTNLSWFEKIGQILKHPKVWGWGDDAELIEAEYPADEEWRTIKEGPVTKPEFPGDPNE